MAQAQATRHFISLPAFENSNITGDYIERVTMTAGTDKDTREVTFSDLMGNGNNIWGLAVQVTGLSSDTMKGTLKFKYNKAQGFMTSKNYDVFTGKSADFSDFYRLDSDSTVLDQIPFLSVKFTFDITGSSDTPVITAAWVSAAYSVVV